MQASSHQGCREGGAPPTPTDPGRLRGQGTDLRGWGYATRVQRELASRGSAGGGRRRSCRCCWCVPGQRCPPLLHAHLLITPNENGVITHSGGRCCRREIWQRRSGRRRRPGRPRVRVGVRLVGWGVGVGRWRSAALQAWHAVRRRGHAWAGVLHGISVPGAGRVGREPWPRRVGHRGAIGRRWHAVGGRRADRRIVRRRGAVRGRPAVRRRHSPGAGHVGRRHARGGGSGDGARLGRLPAALHPRRDACRPEYVPAGVLPSVLGIRDGLHRYLVHLQAVHRQRLCGGEPLIADEALEMLALLVEDEVVLVLQATSHIVMSITNQN